MSVFVTCGPALTGLVQAEAAMDHERISGVFLGQGVECPQVRLDTGEQISLQGPLPEGLTVGAPVEMARRFLMMSHRMQGRAFQILPD
jgi:hypothetical protein